MADGADLKSVLWNKQGAGQEATSVCVVYPWGNQETAASITAALLKVIYLLSCDSLFLVFNDDVPRYGHSTNPAWDL